jgi:DNA-binding NarL/FixJ family response regulator
LLPDRGDAADNRTTTPAFAASSSGGSVAKSAAANRPAAAARVLGSVPARSSSFSSSGTLRLATARVFHRLTQGVLRWATSSLPRAKLHGPEDARSLGNRDDAVLERAGGDPLLVLSVSSQEADVTDVISADASATSSSTTRWRSSSKGSARPPPPDAHLTRIAAVLLKHVRDPIGAGRDLAGGGLSVRELEVLDLMATCRSDQEIAETLAIRPSTLCRHVESILVELQIETRVQAALRAMRKPPGRRFGRS